MKGKYDIELNAGLINYKFTINRNITIIKGDSGTGKTSLINLVKYSKVRGSEINLNCKVDCIVMDNYNWELYINNYSNKIFFVDEESEFINTKKFARYISKGNDNYFVIITRDTLPYLNYSYKEIYEIHNSGKYNFLKRIYDFEDDLILKSDINFNCLKEVLTEDSKSGYELIKEIYKDKNVISLEGKSKIRNIDIDKILLIVDGAAFGNEIDYAYEVLNNSIIYIPESIEYIILKSNIFKDNVIKDILNNIEDYIDSKEYCSYERYFSDILNKYSKNIKFGVNYNKSNLDKFFLNKSNIQKIINILPDKIRPNLNGMIIDFEWD